MPSAEAIEKGSVVEADGVLNLADQPEGPGTGKGPLYTATAIVSLLVAIVGGVNGYLTNRAQATAEAAKTSIDQLTEEVTARQTLSQRIHDSIGALSQANSDSARAAASMNIASLFVLARNPLDRRVLLYIAETSQVPGVIGLYGKLLEKETAFSSEDRASLQEDKELEDEYRGFLADQSQRKDSLQANVRKAAEPNAHATISDAVTVGQVLPGSGGQSALRSAEAQALSDVTPQGASGWIFLGTVSAGDPKQLIHGATTDAAAVPAVGASLVITKYVHLRDNYVDRAGKTLGNIDGLLAPNAKFKTTAVRSVQISTSLAAVWAQGQVTQK